MLEGCGLPSWKLLGFDTLRKNNASNLESVLQVRFLRQTNVQIDNCDLASIIDHNLLYCMLPQKC